MNVLLIVKGVDGCHLNANHTVLYLQIEMHHRVRKHCRMHCKLAMHLKFSYQEDGVYSLMLCYLQGPNRGDWLLYSSFLLTAPCQLHPVRCLQRTLHAEGVGRNHGEQNGHFHGDDLTLEMHQQLNEVWEYCVLSHKETQTGDCQLVSEEPSKESSATGTPESNQPALFLSSPVLQPAPPCWLGIELSRSLCKRESLTSSCFQNVDGRKLGL
ncbi:hypothetical protein ACRRTK_017588 [Alexandromys fortis]